MTVLKVAVIDDNTEYAGNLADGIRACGHEAIPVLVRQPMTILDILAQCSGADMICLDHDLNQNAFNGEDVFRGIPPGKLVVGTSNCPDVQKKYCGLRVSGKDLPYKVGKLDRQIRSFIRERLQLAS